MYETGMSARVLVICRTGWQFAARQLARWWVEPWPLPRAAARSLEIALRPSPLERIAHRWLLIAQFLYAAELGWTGHWPEWVCVLVLAVVWARVSCHRFGHSRRSLRRLILAADGRLHGLVANGDVVGLRLHPSSLSLGHWLLLRVVGAGHRHLLVLGPDNVEPSVLAELRRRVASSRST